MELFVIMLERLGIIVMVAFLMTRIPFFRHLIERHQVTLAQRISITLMFGFFGIIGTYTGVVVSPGEASYVMWVSELAQEEAIANSRVLGIVVAGLLGGWRVGVGAGLIAGGHRFLLGGFTGFACGISAVIAGVIAGIAHRYMKKGSSLSLPLTFFVGVLSETIQMTIILLVARPFDQALALVELIGLPMILANGVGAAVFVLIIRSVIKEEEKMAAVQSGRALNIADKTMIHMRKGLTPESAKQTCEILLQEVNASAVSMTNRSTILSYRGKGADYYEEGEDIKTEATKKVLENGNIFQGNRQEIDQHQNLPSDIKAALIVPLKQKEVIAGTLKFYFHSEKEITVLERELIQGLATMLSHQLELAKVEELEKIARETEIKALQAQVSPHFLFNTLNIIVSMIRTHPERARKLLLSLSSFFRQNLAGTHKSWSSLNEELKHIKSYLEIQKARFSSALEVKWEVNNDLLHNQVPTMTLQPLVENAINHGKISSDHSLTVTISIEERNGHVLVSISDNGRGIDSEKLAYLTKRPMESEKGSGIGLYNVHNRLSNMVSPDSALKIVSEPSIGTTISFQLERRF
ncbi:sensor histidine kinase [Salipaludibacillus aurantiacus]|uniref:histidine kinase n=1 Tax=Salipaludibacillus aurantiacus TaxID=1601833 RepID=A0A1H9X283_9BACI|nr:sensor histidine kinase [Salipaludibacillus aurantiacus]SES40318.1 two-component system, LytT family, sensor histidine kinase LytS [Salipaludibacillus aurantiacus]